MIGVINAQVIDAHELIFQVPYFSACVLVFSQFSDYLDFKDLKLIDFGTLNNIFAFSAQIVNIQIAFFKKPFHCVVK